MILESDFRDYYDFAFSGRGPVLRRMTTEGPSKHEQFRILAAAGYRVPEHGLLGDLLDADFAAGRRHESYVLYDDPNAHCGEGKRLVPAWAVRSNPHMGMPGGDRFFHEKQKFAARFIAAVRPPVSVRRLQVGRRVFALEYSSDDPWRSNCGEQCECRLLGEFDPCPPTGPLPLGPLVAVDLILDGEGEYIAVDLNVAPGMRGVGLERLLPPFDAVAEIEAAVTRCP